MSHRRPFPPLWTAYGRLAQLGLAFLFAGLLLAGLEAVTMGRVTAPALGLGVIGATITPVGMVAMLVASRRHGSDEPGRDENDGDGGNGRGGGGGGAGDDDIRPRPSGGGLTIDWEHFEREFHAYAERARVTIGAAPPA